MTTSCGAHLAWSWRIDSAETLDISSLYVSTFQTRDGNIQVLILMSAFVLRALRRLTGAGARGRRCASRRRCGDVGADLIGKICRIAGGNGPFGHLAAAAQLVERHRLPEGAAPIEQLF